MLHGFEALIDRDGEPTRALLDRLDAAEAEIERLRAALDIARDYVEAKVAYLRQRYRGREQFGRVHEAEGDLAAIDAARRGK